MTKILALARDIEVGFEYIILEKEFVDMCVPGTFTVIGEVSDVVAASFEDLLRENRILRSSLNDAEELLNKVENRLGNMLGELK